ncbi:MAG: hypothetical protein P1V97_11990 [Planctomycetota bacterium]|nr:hypothetical protein [Planctomycetota bacterium]
MTVYPRVFSTLVSVAVTAAVGTTLIQSSDIAATQNPKETLSEVETEPLDEKEAEPAKDPNPDGPGELIDDSKQVVDLRITDGLGGQFIADADEATVGGFSVANLNDSDFDGVVDVKDKVVNSDPDLIVVQIFDLLAEVKETFYTIEVSKNIKLWADKNKSLEVTARKFAISKIKQRFYVEGVEPSSALRDQFITVKVGKYIDTARMTFVWAKRKSVKKELKETLWKDCGVNEGNGSGKGDQAKDLLVGVFKDLFQGTFGPTGFMGERTPRIGYGIGFEYTVFPPNIGDKDLAKKEVYFDMTRQRENYAVGGGGHVRDDSFPKGDTPNDDPGDQNRDKVNDEDNTPKNNHIYSIDKPRLITNQVDNGKKKFFSFVQQANFREYVRVRFDKTPFSNTDIGSRCSLKTKWHCRFATFYVAPRSSGGVGAWRFALPNDPTFEDYKPFGCDLGHHKLVKQKLP